MPFPREKSQYNIRLSECGLKGEKKENKIKKKIGIVTREMKKNEGANAYIKLLSSHE